MIKRLSFLLLLSLYFVHLSSQTRVRVRLFTDADPGYLFFRVTSGQYVIDSYDGKTATVKNGEVFIISRFEERIAIKISDETGFITDSVNIRGSGPEASFSLKSGKGSNAYRNYSGDLRCIPDLGYLLLINTLDLEDYVAGVVKAEGGSGKNEEYFKTQAVIARTYTYKYFRKHLTDGYNLCDDTHCQAFNGITSDALISSSVHITSGEVLVSSDSTLIISAFHSNCGGETSPSEYVWLSAHPYLTKVVDPYCVTSRNATWRKTVSINDWVEMLSHNGYREPAQPAESYLLNQQTRIQNYFTGSFKVPFSKIRIDLGLRSAWFSISAKGDSLLLTGRGYGHGVGLCQEGAMVMASTGKRYEEILKFYYPGVSIVGIQAAKNDKDDK